MVIVHSESDLLLQGGYCLVMVEETESKRQL